MKPHTHTHEPVAKRQPKPKGQMFVRFAAAELERGALELVLFYDLRQLATVVNLTAELP